ncbi:MAG: hypothetical protein JSS42_16315 [Proteobacteria bacterium]|uniref:hypothetical protein n=1 Tax=Rudaea sp. TaxID=2136325 RepID=UPI00321FE8BD|nr:hypothetical protein [Pseudomonadota bacterium]
MRSLLPVVLACGLIAAQAHAQGQKKSDDGLPPVQPPPAMDEPSAATTPAKPANSAKTVPIANSDAEARAAAEEARRRTAQPVAALPPEPEKKFDSPGLPPEVQKAAEATELPVVTVRQEGNETITEYRKHGKIFAQYFKSKDTGTEKWYVDPGYKGPMPPDLDAGMHGKPGAVQYKVFGW